MSGQGPYLDDTPRLPQLLDGLTEAADVPDLPVTGLALSSQGVRAGDIFLAVQGTRMHGLAFAADAVERGASCIVYQSGAGAVAPDLSVPAVAVPDLFRRVGLIASRFQGEPSASLRITAITGTDGKTSVAWLMAGALAHLRVSAHYIGTLGAGCPTGLSATQHTTPDPLRLQAALAEARDAEVRAVVMEVSSHALDQGRLAGTQVDCAVLTNLGRDHLDYHADVPAYHAAKKRLFTECAPRRVVLNADDRVAREWIAEMPQAWTYALDHDARVRAVDPHFTQEGVRFVLTCDDEQAQVKAPLMGRFNVANLTAVGAALLAQGYALKQVAAALSRAGVVPGRMQPLRASGKPLVLVDYAHTPQALSQALLASKAHARGKLWCVFGCGGDRDTGKRALMGQTAAAVADYIVLTDDNPRSEDPESITAAIAEGVGAHGHVETINRRADAIAHAIRSAKADDIVLIAGKGHETTQQYGAVEYPFSDIEHARAALGLESAS
ncbi:UDP-N-acetylmuramoyl-L-alanyl-D-glutamate--2,6-diaminopimelate ligase [Algiphilus sp. NNCM1]|uniref:UDP-N-acetylmuramoyl-L-alanyl-D-glutamate--2, 6-diaminopimelate ligase n=1 Tax=Algiphilus sp. TaxID=1872431 RepID=UPI001CA67F90|nr:UDP-N-acetylmuramoyl-L-alanyl-D-glutamate--2,6-diaminopimelate ligase [Algiphilus sp.]MBY8965881.1 UDP-N-acetylmuramoyl-L-alanyl-D-glutamate--2,6-diaminopimelate ligase [Algiphilus acroporae]MCI5104136.1 UDP-N-acetylmuramoyl-L-alanyl-D-glutamate--2,6-diaminopimelate ligase [Algiphilus sp.]